MPQLQEIEKLLGEYYQLDAEDVVKLPGELDGNYRVTCGDSEYLLKIAHSGRNLDLLDLENRILDHLQGKKLDADTPTVIRNVRGKEITHWQGKDGTYQVRLLSWLEGTLLAKINPHSPALLEDLGRKCGQLTLALVDFDHPKAHRSFDWNIEEVQWTDDFQDLFDGEDRDLIRRCRKRIDDDLYPLLGKLRRSVCYYDANDYNVIVDPEGPVIRGFIDFGDVVYTVTLAELAIACTYALMHAQDPMESLIPLVRGYHQEFPLLDEEMKVLGHCIVARLIISLTFSQRRSKEEPDNEYLQVSAKPGWALLRKLDAIHPRYIYYVCRYACRQTPHPQESALSNVLSNMTPSAFILDHEVNSSRSHILDLSVSSLLLANQTDVESDQAFNQVIEEAMHGCSWAIGRYLEPRPVYTTSAYKVQSNNGPEWRTIHIGLDLFAKAGTAVYTPLQGVVHSVKVNDGDRDYGPTVILEHEIEGLTFFTLFGHLSNSCFEILQIGQTVEEGQVIGHLGTMDVNGGWPPHVHFQIILDPFDDTGDFPGVCRPSEMDIWSSLCPDPGLLLGIVGSRYESIPLTSLVSDRNRCLGGNLSLSYDNPLHISRGSGVHLFDQHGRRYLDMVNNVAHVGHEHPDVVRAGQQQMAVLNTNTRYFHPAILEFAHTLIPKMPAGLDVVYFCNSGSEANELALRMARVFSGNRHVVALQHGYHGNTAACIDVSSYKFDGPGGFGCPEHTHILSMPDPFRGKYAGLPEEEQVKQYADRARKMLSELASRGEYPAALITESILSCGGQVVPPKRYFDEIYSLVRQAGGLCIADEVQTGVGRVGSHFWAFELHEVKPDIVTIGKPIGNGHPLGIVVTTREVADRFDNGMEYFNTFGGNPVSMVIGTEVLRVVERENLQENASKVGALLLDELHGLQKSFPLMGDVRGHGLFIGIELINNPEKKTPAKNQAHYLVNRMRAKGILLSTDGPDHNVIKIKPPLVFDQDDADMFLHYLEETLREDNLRIE